MRGRSAVLSVALCAFLAGGCSGATKPPFARTAEDVAGGLSAAALTLEDLHGERITREYAAATLAVLRSQLEQAPEELRSSDGAPDTATVDRLVADVTDALAAVRSPCLERTCDPAVAVARLRAVAGSLDRAAGG